jgi:hypothetical protein
VKRAIILLALASVTSCQARTLTKRKRGGDSLDLAGLVARDSLARSPVAPRVIAEPSVVVFWLRSADTLSVDDQSQAFEDLRYYTEQVAPALEANGIRLLVTNAETVYVAPAGRRRRTVLLSGLDYPYGYLLVDPGGPERILTGVYADDELMDELRAYFDLPSDTTSAQPRITT